LKETEILSVEQQNGLETVIGGGNPAQADQHFATALELE
jgi:hypothetical protein